MINNEPQINQRQVAVCSAFNGWLYAVYSLTDSINNSAAFKVMRSTDNGITWAHIISGVFSEVFKSFTSIDIEVTGDSVSNLKVFIALVASSGTNPLISRGEAHVYKFNGVTGDFEDVLLTDYSSTCIAIASDYNYPAGNSNTHSIAVILSKFYSTVVRDSIIIFTCSNGGISFDNRRVIASATNFNIFHKVDITYGRSSSMNNGRCYVVWEEQANLSSSTGHIYTAHSEPNFNSPFTIPIKLDSIDGSALNNSRNPVISCQYNTTDNDSSNVTEMVLFDKYLPAENRYDIAGFYNLKSTTYLNEWQIMSCYPRSLGKVNNDCFHFVWLTLFQCLVTT